MDNGRWQATVAVFNCDISYTNQKTKNITDDVQLKNSKDK